MAEHDDPLLQSEFSAYRSSLMTEVHPVGPAAVRATVRRRRRVTVTAAGALALALVAGPVAGYAALNRDHAAPPAPADSVEPNLPPTPAPSETPATMPAPPDGWIERADLLAARVDLPSWPPHIPESCTTDSVRLREPQKEYLPELWGDLRYGDLDGDGATETVALVACRYGEALAKQVVAFDRDKKGRIVTMGRIAGTREEPDDIADLLADITDFMVEADGQVRVQVADLQPCCGTPSYWKRTQWRTYGWDGTRFTQTDGPTKWGPDPRLTDLRVTAGPLTLGPPDGTGWRAGTVKVTVSNRGPTDVARLGLYELNHVGEPDGGDWDRCEPARGRSDWPPCMLPGLAAGKEVSYTFRFRLGPAGLPDEALAVRAVHYSGDLRYWKDLTPGDNFARIRPAR